MLSFEGPRARAKREQAAAGVVHEGIFCDGCATPGAAALRPIVGVRYSRGGADYDLCGACFGKLPAAERRGFDALAEPAPPDAGAADDGDDDAAEPAAAAAARRSALDSQIASLEARLQRGSGGGGAPSGSGSESDSSDSDGSDSDGEEAEGGAALQRIQPLSAEQLPEYYRKKGKAPVRKGNAAAAAAASAAAAAAAAYEKAANRSLYCRVCSKQFETVEELQEHRGGAEHQAAEERDRRASYCPLCDKQFTSPEQLREHVSGKWHKAREAAAQGGEWVAPSHSKRPGKRRSSDAKAKAKSKGKGDGAQNGAAQEAKPLFVRFGTETGGQIRVKGARKVLGGRMEKKRRKESNT